jgi:hypothetical protein
MVKTTTRASLQRGTRARQISHSSLFVTAIGRSDDDAVTTQGSTITAMEDGAP